MSVRSSLERLEFLGGVDCRPFAARLALLGVMMAEMSAQTTLDIVTLVVAIFAFGVALASLVWHFASWRLSGVRVTVDIGLSLAYSSGEPLITLTARNIGRTDKQITSWAIRLPDERSYVPGLSPGSFIGPPMPLRLAAGHSETWNVFVPGTKETLSSAGYPPDTELRDVVFLGSGKYVASKKAIRL